VRTGRRRRTIHQHRAGPPHSTTLDITRGSVHVPKLFKAAPGKQGRENSGYCGHRRTCHHHGRRVLWKVLPRMSVSDSWPRSYWHSTWYRLANRVGGEMAVGLGAAGLSGTQVMSNFSWCGRAVSAVPLFSVVPARRTARR